MFKKKILFGFFFLMFMMAFGSAQSIVMQETLDRQGQAYFSDGFVINSITQSHLKVGENATFYMSVYDDVGRLQDKDDVVCILGYASPNGDTVTLVSEAEMTFLNSNTIFVIPLNASTLTERGDYVWNINCMGGAKGGYLNGHFNVNGIGEELSVAHSIKFNSAMFFLLILFAMALIGLFSIENYIGKFVLYWVSHLLFVVGTFSVWQFNIGYTTAFVGLAGIWKVLFYVSTIAVFPMLILSIAWIVYIHLFNEHFQKLVDKGEDPEKAFAMTNKKRGGWFNGM